MRLLHIVRGQNLLIMALVSLGLWYYIIPKFQIDVLIKPSQFFIHLAAMVLIAAGGYVINDLYDIETDKINKPEKVWIPHYLTLQSAWWLYGILTGLGLILGFIVSYLSNIYIYAVMYIIGVTLLFFYAKKWKKKLIFNNLIIAFLTSYPTVFIYSFTVDFFELSINENHYNVMTFQSVIIFLTLFAFGLNWIREIVKDVEDTIGDKACGSKSFSTEFSLNQTKVVIYLLTTILFLFLMFFAGKYWNSQPFFSIYLVFGVGMSLGLFFRQIDKTNKFSDFKKPSTLLKIIMLVGIFSIFLIQF